MLVTFDETEVEALKLFLGRWWSVQSADYEASEGRSKVNHIFHDMKVIDKALGRPNLGKGTRKQRKRAV